MAITFQSSNADRDLLLFASNAPLASSIDLLKSTATVPLDPGTTRYLLAALPDTSYWFAVLDANLYKVGQVPLVQGLNATANPVRVPPRNAGPTAEAVAARRAQPLPSLDPAFGVQSGVDLGDSDAPVLPAVKQVSAVTSKAITWLLNAAGQETPAPQSPALLEGDTAAGSGETGQLLAIVHGPFRQNDMITVEKQLLDFLSLPHASQLEAHARFYLGQSYFFEGKTREALLEFLQAEDTYYLPVQAWINASLDRLEAQDR